MSLLLLLLLLLLFTLSWHVIPSHQTQPTNCGCAFTFQNLLLHGEPPEGKGWARPIYPAAPRPLLSAWLTTGGWRTPCQMNKALEAVAFNPGGPVSPLDSYKNVRAQPHLQKL